MIFIPPPSFIQLKGVLIKAITSTSTQKSFGSCLGATHERASLPGRGVSVTALNAAKAAINF